MDKEKINFDLSFGEKALYKIGLNSLALRKYESRLALESKRAYYKGAKQSRLTKDWERDTSKDPNKAWQTDAQIIKERANGLAESTGYGKRIKSALVDGIIGEQITTQIIVDWFPDWKPRTPEDLERKRQENLTINNELEEFKKYWSENCDLEDKKEWGQMQRLTLGTTAVDGECFKQSVWLEDERFPLKYRILKSDRVNNSTYLSDVEPGNEVINGIEYDKNGREVAFHIFQNSYKVKSLRIPKKFMKNTYLQERPEQGRGFSWFKPIISDLNNIINITDYALVARRVQSAIALITTKKTPKAGNLNIGAGSGTKDSGSGLKHKYLTPGMILDAGERDVHSHIPTPSNDLDPLTKLLMRGVGAGVGCSYELISGDYRDTTFAGGRLAKVDTDRHHDVLHNWFIGTDEKKAHKDFIDMCVLMGIIRNRTIGGRQIKINRVNLYAAKFSRRKISWGVNPYQEVRAAAELIKNKMSTYRKEIEARGDDFEDHLKQLENEDELWTSVFPDLNDEEQAEDITKEADR